jgi:hypothetical protein
LRAYLDLAESNGGHPDAGRRLRSWALAAGFPAEHVTATASSWVFATDAERSWWAEMWAERTTKSSTAQQYVAKGIATEAELQAIADAWHDWSRHPDGFFDVGHGELVCVA